MRQAIRRPSAADRLGHLLLRPSVPSWLISLVVHLVLLVIFALTFTSVTPPRGGIIGLTVSEAPAYGEDQEVGMVAESAGGTAGEGERSASAAAAGAIGTLAAALDSGPPSDPAAVLPASLGSLGGDALEGGGVGSAAGLGTGDGAGRGGSGKGLGGKARTSVFGAEGEGYKFVYVFDRSASMGGAGRNALAAAKVELLASLKNLQRTHQFQIVFYNETPTIFNPTGDAYRLLFATEENKAAAERFVASISAYDGTRHEDALMMAIRLQPDVIFFLTDADEPKLGPNQLARLHRAAAGITINAIEFGFGPQADADNFLVQLARQNDGRHVYVDISKVLPVHGK